MPHPRRSCRGALLLSCLLVSLALPPAAQARSDRAGAQAKPEVRMMGALQGVWKLLSRLWEKEGSGIDPFGQPSSSPSGDGTTSITPYGSDAPRGNS
jgi:hypothetical protein